MTIRQNKYVYADTNDYTINIQDVIAPNTDEFITFVHIDTYNMSKSVIKELRVLLNKLLGERTQDVSFFSPYPESLRLAQVIKKLDTVVNVDTPDGTPITVGVWECK